jgi:hypothetical protein
VCNVTVLFCVYFINNDSSTMLADLVARGASQYVALYTSFLDQWQHLLHTTLCSSSPVLLSACLDQELTILASHSVSTATCIYCSSLNRLRLSWPAFCRSLLSTLDGCGLWLNSLLLDVSPPIE